MATKKDRRYWTWEQWQAALAQTSSLQGVAYYLDMLPLMRDQESEHIAADLALQHALTLLASQTGQADEAEKLIAVYDKLDKWYA